MHEIEFLLSAFFGGLVSFIECFFSLEGVCIPSIIGATVVGLIVYFLLRKRFENKFILWGTSGFFATTSVLFLENIIIGGTLSSTVLAYGGLGLSGLVAGIVVALNDVPALYYKIFCMLAVSAGQMYQLTITSTSYTTHPVTETIYVILLLSLPTIFGFLASLGLRSIYALE